MSYFKHHFASNSDLKEIVARHEGHAKPENIQDIFDFGTAFHAAILEPHKVEWNKFSEEEIEKLRVMRDTFWKDELCRNIVTMADFRREHEFYRINRFGLDGVRCKCDGESASLGTILELKGLSVSTQKSFIESVEHMNYDMGAAFYIETATGSRLYKRKLIIGISKTVGDRKFKVLIDRDHVLFKTGMDKIRKAVSVWRMYGLK